MPAPIPLPVRQRRWDLARRGHPAGELADRFRLPLRTVRHLLGRFRHDPGRRAPARRPGPGRPRGPDHPLRAEALALRQRYPRRGAGSRGFARLAEIGAKPMGRRQLPARQARSSVR